MEILWEDESFQFGFEKAIYIYYREREGITKSCFLVETFYSKFSPLPIRQGPLGLIDSYKT